MGFFNWLTGSTKSTSNTKVTANTDIHSSLMGNDATRPYFTSGQTPSTARNATPEQSVSTSASRLEQRRSERNARRELLFQVVRESMVRVGVLSSGFRFKVLALDQRGKTFLVMMDLSPELGAVPEKLAEIETLIANTAKNRYELVIQSVYWRFTEAVSSASAHGGTATAPALRAPMAAAPIERPASPAGQHKSHDPIDHDEVEAFKRALAAGTQPSSARPTVSAQKPGILSAKEKETATRAAALAAINNTLLLTGYEDTEMPDPDEPAPALSATQYGELR